MSTLVRCQGLGFSYGDHAVLADLDLDIPAGQLLGVIGPNGAGKSTLVRLLLGLQRPTAGRVLLEDRALQEWPQRELARRVAAVMQDENVEFPFSVGEVVLSGRYPHLPPWGWESAADRAAAEEAMRATEILALAERPLYTLSGGERKRVWLARALAQSPSLLVLDEPVAALDIHHQIGIFELLAARHRAGLTIIVVVHDLNLAAAYCERLLLLVPGQRPQVGGVEEILTYRRVREAFSVEVYVGVNEITGKRFLLPMHHGNAPK